MPPYNHKAVEAKWQKRWEKERIFEVADSGAAKKKQYILDMFPYPSGAGLHVGHPEGYTATDIYSRYVRMKGYQVLHPMGWDAFGLPAENYAIKSGIHPKESTEQNIKTFTRQIKSLGFSYDWSREVNTSSPDYYRWTQWLFLQLYKAGLAYKKAAPVNWCPSCQTVLANEQVVDGHCERCGTAVARKNLEQWFFKITGESKKEKGISNKGRSQNSYPERLLNNLDTLDWPEPIKTMQRNWIGRSEGASIIFPLVDIPGQKDGKHSVEIFTTRPDTIFGATFMAISPELAQQWIDVGWQADVEVKKYIKKALAERTKNDKAAEPKKTGVFSGIYAVNPANKEKIPVWVADYVLAGYGTGAIMAVPAHDERDFEFAKKYHLPITEVAVKVFGEKKQEAIRRDSAAGILVKDGKYLVMYDKKTKEYRIVSGGYEGGESDIQTIEREIKEETGYLDFEIGEYLGQIQTNFFALVRDEERHKYQKGYLVRLLSDKHEPPMGDEDRDRYDLYWLSYEKALEKLMSNEIDGGEYEFLRRAHNPKEICFSGSGVIVNSEKFDGMESEKAKWKITEAVGGKRTVQYKLRDWLISRQRYWGAPIPIIYCDDCGEQPVPEKDLPVELPKDVDFRPKGESPLARSKSFHKVRCPKCKKPARRESDTMDTFVDSSWYFLRYTDPKNKKEFASKKALKAWLPVDTYVGGAEHAVLHLMYARFITMALHDLGHFDFEEPFLKLRNQGLILGENGEKMSKSRGNVINPDDVIGQHGADTMRMYEMFMGPLEDAKPWDMNGIIGVRRFLERVWNMQGLVSKKEKGVSNKGEIERELHRLIKKVGDDIQSFDFNTAVSQFMIFVNVVYKVGEISKEHFETFLKALHPFAPHMTNELWEKLGHKDLLERGSWPKYDEKLLVADEAVYAVQVNGKVRGSVTVAADAGESAVATAAKQDEKIAKHLAGKNIVKTIFVEGRLVNFVVK